jgi:hypothetical protein
MGDFVDVVDLFDGDGLVPVAFLSLSSLSAISECCSSRDVVVVVMWCCALFALAAWTERGLTCRYPSLESNSQLYLSNQSFASHSDCD